MFLSNSKLIKQDVLAELPEDIVDDFIKTYCSDNDNKGIKIPVTFTFPQQQPTGPFILLQYMRGSENEDLASIGNIQGNIHSGQQGNTKLTKLLIHVDGGKAYVELPEPVHEVYEVREATNYTLKDNRIYVRNIPPYADGKHYLHVTYAQKLDRPEPELNPYGIVMDEQVVVDTCSTNMNTLRCLSGIMKALNIYLKSTLEANSDIQLPTIQDLGTDLLDQINSPETTISGQQLYYRRLTISYTVTHTLPTNAGLHIDKYQIQSGGRGEQFD